MNRRCRRIGVRRGFGGRAAVCVEHARSAGDVVRQYRKARQRHSRPRVSGAATALRRRHQGRQYRRGDPLASARRRLSDGRGAGDAAFCRLAHRFRQPLGRTGRRSRSVRQPAKRRPCCRISAARCPTTFLPMFSGCRRSGCRTPIPAARSTRPTSTFCSSVTEEALGIMAGLFWDLGEMTRAFARIRGTGDDVIGTGRDIRRDASPTQRKEHRPGSLSRPRSATRSNGTTSRSTAISPSMCPRRSFRTGSRRRRCF